MFQVAPISRRVKKTLAQSVLTIAAFSLIAAGAVLQVQAQGGARRPLPKPAGGARGFEQYAGKDASSRLIAAGSTRGAGDVRKPIAPLEGLAFDPHPMFKWEPAFGTKSYHFTLYEGDAAANKTAPVVYEADVPTTQLIYPNTAKQLMPGKLYSWRVATPMSSGKGWDMGPVVSFFVLSGEDAAQLKTALAKDKLTMPKTPEERLRQAKIFEEYGVWYDALRIASELADQNPDDAATAAYLDALVDHLEGHGK
ncbi:MAG: DUF928 domain-containing protein [Pyrinomonadaceae bacterium]